MASHIYCQFQEIGFNLGRPKQLFNQPSKPLECKWKETIYADKNFTEIERLYILEALDNLHYFCNGLIQLEIEFTLDPSDKATLQEHCVLLKAKSDWKIISDSTEHYKTNIVGLCVYNRNQTRHLYVVIDRLYCGAAYKSVILHELFHLLWLNHTAKPSIMYEHCVNLVHPTIIDAQEIIRVWDTEDELSLQDLRYLKLAKEPLASLPEHPPHLVL